MGQRLSRAKAKIKLAGVPFSVPQSEDMPLRLHAVLEAIYAAFATAWIDPTTTTNDLAEEAIWLGRLVCQLMPGEPEALGLSALMLFLHSRRNARRGDGGQFVPLSDQTARSWDADLIAEAEQMLARAHVACNIGRYQLEAAIQSVHAARAGTQQTDWPAIVTLYDALLDRFASPVVALNRAVAVAEVFGTDNGLAAMPDPDVFPELREFQPYWAARAELLVRAGRHNEATAAFDLAIGLATDHAERLFLLGKRDGLTSRL